MFGCRACRWRCIQALAHDARASQPLRALPSAPHQQQRFHGTARQSPAPPPEQPSDPRRDDYKKSLFAAGVKKRERRTLTRMLDGSGDTRLSPDTPWHVGRRPHDVAEKDWQNRKRELRYLADPVELASFVKQELNKGKTKEMMLLVQMASHSMQCIVSWNHLIDYLLNEGRMAAAFKVYNDMKNRAQFPDAYTYSIVLRGLCENAHHSGALERALAVYHSLYAPNSRVQPSIIHTNLVLKACARQLNMDALWGVAAKIPETGRASATAITFCTILNAIRQSLLVNTPSGESDTEAAMRIERGIVEGRRVWEDVVGKWRNGDLTMSDELVCAMGRLLLVGSRPRDWDDVLSLVEQTMDIPRMVPRLGSPARAQAGFPELRAAHVIEQLRFDDDHLGPGKPPARGDEFLPIATTRAGSSRSSPLVYARPTNDTLSMVTESCQKIAAGKAAEEYWNLMTESYGIVPDLNNLNQRLRILRLTRSSAKAIALLRDMLGSKKRDLQPRPGTFRIVMSTCVRDKNNHNSFRHANQVLELMMATLEDADPKSVVMYTKLAVTMPLARKEDLVEALTRLLPVIQNIRLQLGVGAAAAAPHHGATPLQGEDRQHAIRALRGCYGVFDRLLLSNELAREERRPYVEERSRLGAYLHRIINGDGERARKRQERADGAQTQRLEDGLQEDYAS